MLQASLQSTCTVYTLQSTVHIRSASMHTSYNHTSSGMGVVRSILCSVLDELLCDDDMPGVRLHPQRALQSKG